MNFFICKKLADSEVWRWVYHYVIRLIEIKISVFPMFSDQMRTLPCLHSRSTGARKRKIADVPPVTREEFQIAQIEHACSQPLFECRVKDFKKETNTTTCHKSRKTVCRAHMVYYLRLSYFALTFILSCIAAYYWFMLLLRGVWIV